MTWRILMEQDGGCDYTIGCGIALIDLEAQTLEEATEEAEEFFMHEDNQHYLMSDDRRIAKASLIQDDNDFLPILSWKTRLEYRQGQEESIRQEKKELAELERLKKKYEK